MLSLFRQRPALTFALLAAVFFVPGLGAVHLFDWDEINFAEIAREMLVSGNWLQPRIDHQPFHEKPPLFIWLQALSMSMFGVNEFAARFPNALCGAITLFVLQRIGARLRGETFGWLWALAYFGSVLPHLYFRSGIIDPWFNLFIFLGVNDLIGARDTPAGAHGNGKARDLVAVRAGIWLGLAVLTKGPVGILVPGLCAVVVLIGDRFSTHMPLRRVLGMLLALVLVPLLWFGVDLVRNGPEFVVAFFWRQVAMLTTEDAGHGGFFGYHVVVLLLGCFPASVFALVEFLKPTRGDATHTERRRWMVVLFFTVLVLFSLVRTKIVHYSSLCYFPLTYLAALQLQRLWNGEKAVYWSRVLLGGIGSLFAVVTLALPYLGARIELLKPFTAADPFAAGNLEASVTWPLSTYMPGLWMVLVLALGHVFFAAAAYRKGIIAVFGGTAIFITLTLYHFIQRIEAYSQRAAITFFQARQGEHCHVITYGYKSYAQLFYTDKPEPDGPVIRDPGSLLSAPIDRPVYVSARINDAEELAAYPGLRELYRENGFVFFRRDP